MVELVLVDENEVGGIDGGEGGMMSSKKYTVEEVACHNSANDCWLVIHGKVYDVTKYLDDHPGGDQVLLIVAGEDATDEFEEAGHSSDAWKLMERYLVGQVDMTSTSTSAKYSSQFLYKAVPAATSVLVVGLVVATFWWRKKRTS